MLFYGSASRSIELSRCGYQTKMKFSIPGQQQLSGSASSTSSTNFQANFRSGFICLSLALLLGLYSSIGADARSEAQKLKELGDFLFFHGDRDEAIEKFKKAAELEPEMIDAHMSLVNLYLQGKDRKSAIKHAERCIELEPDSADYRILLGNLYKAEKDFDGAVEQFEKALEAKASKGIVYNALGYTYLQTDEISKAEEIFEKALHLEDEKSASDASLGLAIAKFRLDKKEEAFSVLEAHIKRFGESFAVLQTKGHLLAGADRSQQAVETYLKALKLEPSNARLHESLGNQYFKLGKTDDSEKAFEKSIELDQESAGPYYALGILYQKRGKLRAAAEQFEKGAFFDKDRKTAEKMKLFASSLRSRASGVGGNSYLSVGDDSISRDDALVRPTLLFPAEIFPVKYSTLLDRPNTIWKRYQKDAKDASLKRRSPYSTPERD